VGVALPVETNPVCKQSDSWLVSRLGFIYQMDSLFILVLEPVLTMLSLQVEVGRPNNVTMR
jgi:hypothetical protein